MNGHTNSKGKFIPHKQYFNIHFSYKDAGKTENAEKGVSAVDVKYIKDHKSEFLGRGRKITKIDSKVYSNVKNDKQLHQAMQTRHNYTVKNGVRIEHKTWQDKKNPRKTFHKFDVR